LYDASRGWLWVPGGEWASAWVSWRYGDGYIGWAPIPPVIGWSDGAGLIPSGLAIDEWIPPFWYCFVEEEFFFKEQVKDYITLSARNDTLVKLTKNVTSYAASDHHVINRAIDIDRIEKDTGQAINRYRIVDVESRRAECRARVKDGEMAFYRPDVSTATRGPAPRSLSSNQPARATQQPFVTDDMLKWQGKERRKL